MSIRDEALALAKEYGYSDDLRAPRAPPGKFEGEPWFTPWYYEQVMNGNGETLSVPYADEADGDLLEVNSEERAAFDLEPDTVAIVLWYNSAGFVSLQELDQRTFAKLQEEYGL
jgi:hypothetical protein